MKEHFYCGKVNILFIQYIWTFRNQFKSRDGGLVGGWHGRLEIIAISAFNLVEVEVEFGKYLNVKSHCPKL